MIKAFLHGLDIMGRLDEVILSASTGAAAAGINGSTYHSALGMSIRSLGKGKCASNKTILRNRGRRILIIDEVSMIGTHDLVRLNEQCERLWNSRQDSDTLFGGIPLVIFLGDFQQFSPVGGTALFQTPKTEIDKRAGEIWKNFKHVLFLTEQMRQAEDVTYQEMLARARSATLTQEDVDILNGQTTEIRLAQGEVLPKNSIIRLNIERERANRRQLEAFARQHNQKIYMFPALTKPPLGLRRREMHQQMLAVGEVQGWKGTGMMLYSPGMPGVLLDNKYTKGGLVNRTIRTVKGVRVEESQKCKFVKSHIITTLADFWS